MHFSLAIIALFCVSTINAAPANEESANFNGISSLVQMFLRGAIKEFEISAPGWEADKSLEYNTIIQFNKALDAHGIPSWRDELSLEENLDIAIYEILKTQGISELNLNQTIVDNIKSLVFGVEVSDWLPKDKAEFSIYEFIINLITKLNISNLDVNKSIKINVDRVVAASLYNIGRIDPKASLKTIVDAVIVNALELIKFPGYSSKITLDANLDAYIAEAFNNLPF